MTRSTTATATLDPSDMMPSDDDARIDLDGIEPAADPGVLTVDLTMEPASSDPDARDRRSARRRPAAQFGQELRLTLPGAAEARPLNVSATGVLTETTQRLCPGRTVDLFLRLNGVRRVLRARVVRSVVHALVPRPLFRAALQFEDPCRLPECED